ncbi:MAG: TldD/PmbA family protein [Clostridiales bacterium]|nr:TldD/PmbA family protein [Clostridiales bacterium]
MAFSKFLESKRNDCKELVAELLKRYSYASILGSDVSSFGITANKSTSAINEGTLSECGFVVKLHNGRSFFEYSLDDISGDKVALADKIASSLEVSSSISDDMIECNTINDEPLVQSFSRECDRSTFTDKDILDTCIKIKDDILSRDERIVNAMASVSCFSVSKLFISKNRELDQYYSWANGFAIAVLKDGDKIVQARETTYSHLLSEAINTLPSKVDRLVDKAIKLASAKPIVPGVYDVITDPSITGLIAHEAFGHGVEMDQFVKDRALAKQYLGDYVASPICNMKDGAASALSTASYFFDDDGVLAHDTQIIKDGILVSGISDVVSATQLGTEPTGNGRRQSFKRKAYSRMTNTFFEAGNDKLEDMISSIKHGYMLFETNNGMEDPKNWQIQCTAEYGIEIVDGKLTDNYVSPVVMSGSVPELLKSITMISDDFKVIGAGSCGKGYKEWVRVSDGGPALKARVKLA